MLASEAVERFPEPCALPELPGPAAVRVRGPVRKASALVDCGTPGLSVGLASACALAARGRGGGGVFICDVT